MSSYRDWDHQRLLLGTKNERVVVCVSACACPITRTNWSRDHSSQSRDGVPDLWLAAGFHTWIRTPGYNDNCNSFQHKRFILILLHCDWLTRCMYIVKAQLYHRHLWLKLDCITGYEFQTVLEWFSLLSFHALRWHHEKLIAL